MSFPETYFSTPLSGSDSLVKERIRNIVYGQRKRPPVWLMALVVLMIAGCGYLVSCQSTQPGSGSDVGFVMDVQYYDSTWNNYIEIPRLNLTGKEADAINAVLADLKAEYQPILDGTASGEGSLPPMAVQCQLYPARTERYLSLLLLRTGSDDVLLSSGMPGLDVVSLVYDLEEARRMTAEEAVSLAGLTREELISQVMAQLDAELQEELAGEDLDVLGKDPSLDGFWIGQDGAPVFCVTATVDDADNDVRNAVLETKVLYTWIDGDITRYTKDGSLEFPPLIPAEKCLDLEPSLWRQWYFSDEDSLLSAQLYQSIQNKDHFKRPTSWTLAGRIRGERYTLEAEHFFDEEFKYFNAHPNYALVIGVQGPDGALEGASFTAYASGGVPSAVCFNQDGTDYLLYTANSRGPNDYSGGEAGLIAFNGRRGSFTWVWPVEGDLRTNTAAKAEYDAYWEDHKAILTPGGVDIFIENPDSGSFQWVYDDTQIFYSADVEPELLRAARVWLEENTWTQLGTSHTSALWRIEWLTPERRNIYSLNAVNESRPTERFHATLEYDSVSGTMISD